MPPAARRPSPPSPSQRVLWKLTKDSRTAVVVRREHPHEDVIVITVGDELLTSEVFRKEPRVQEFSVGMRQTFDARG